MRYFHCRSQNRNQYLTHQTTNVCLSQKVKSEQTDRILKLLLGEQLHAIALGYLWRPCMSFTWSPSTPWFAKGEHVTPAPYGFKSRLAARKEGLYLSLCHLSSGCLSVCLSVCGRTPKAWKHDFWAAQATEIWNFFFQKRKLLKKFQNFFHLKILFHLQKVFPLSLFCTFLGVSCHPQCSKKKITQNFFSLKIFLGEARHDTMLPSISSFLSSIRKVLAATRKVLTRLFMWSRTKETETGSGREWSARGNALGSLAASSLLMRSASETALPEARRHVSDTVLHTGISRLIQKSNAK